MPERYEVCKVSELPPGSRKIIEVAGRSIGVFNIEGKFHAIRNACPHQLAPLCLGQISGTTAPTDRVNDYRWHRQGEIIRCPWHGWEFDITTGQSVFNPHKCRVKYYEVSVESAESSTTQTEPQTRTIDSTQPDPSVETYAVSVEAQCVFIHV